MNSTPVHSAQDYPGLRDAVQRISMGVAGKHAADVDARSRFPSESIEALREVGALSAPVPRELGGAGCDMRELAHLCSTLSLACGSTGMILAMHYVQVACIVRHGLSTDFFCDYLRQLVQRQYILASMTSEIGTSGDTRSSVCAVERHADGRFTLRKDATTGSYCAHADGILVTCRRDVEAARGDQVLLLVKQSDCQLTQTTTWDAMGMRGTCSPGFRLESSGSAHQILPSSFANISAQTMVPYSHILWASLWWGLGADAVDKAGTFVRETARKSPGTVPAAATRLAEISLQLQALRQNWFSMAQSFDEIALRRDAEQELLSIPWALRLNDLKIYASEAAPQIVHRALQIVGMPGYKNDSPFSLCRQYRDSLSGSLMISNDRIIAKNASMLLALRNSA